MPTGNQNPFDTVGHRTPYTNFKSRYYRTLGSSLLGSTSQWAFRLWLTVDIRPPPETEAIRETDFRQRNNTAQIGYLRPSSEI